MEKTKEQYQKDIIEFLSQNIDPMGKDKEIAPATGIAKKSGNMPSSGFYEALFDLVEKGAVEAISTTGLTGHDWYRLAGANRHNKFRDEWRS
jgi:deoxyhypusine synthase